MNISEFFRITPQQYSTVCIIYSDLKTLKSVKKSLTKVLIIQIFDLTLEYFLDEEEVNGFKTNYVDKHKIVKCSECRRIGQPI